MGIPRCSIHEGEDPLAAERRSFDHEMGFKAEGAFLFIYAGETYVWLNRTSRGLGGQ
jgi:predicted NUDIX family NTP pyrophosphohydrolase